MKSSIVYGFDEVGRGSFAGPLVAAAVSLPSLSKESVITKIESESDSPIRDSKKLSSSKRSKIFTSALQTNIPIFLASISAREINQKGIGWANKQIFVNLIQEILFCHSGKGTQKPYPESINNDTNFQFIIDGNLKISLPGQVVASLPKADSLYPEVSLASIIAKVVRDSYMQDLHANFPHYSFNTNMGYGTKAHIAALKTHGQTPHHRDQFVQTALNKIGK